MERVLIIGSNGAGKSTFSYQLAERTGLPLIHLDQIYWYGNWQVRPREDFQSRVLAEAQKPSWIIEGNNVRSLEQRLQYADTLFWFEFSPLTCVISILKRDIQYRRQVRPDMPDDCVSRFSPSFLKYAWNFNRDNRPRILAALEHFPDVRVIRFTSRRQVKRYFNRV